MELMFHGWGLIMVHGFLNLGGTVVDIPAEKLLMWVGIGFACMAVLLIGGISYESFC